MKNAILTNINNFINDAYDLSTFFLTVEPIYDGSLVFPSFRYTKHIFIRKDNNHIAYIKANNVDVIKSDVSIESKKDKKKFIKQIKKTVDESFVFRTYSSNLDTDDSILGFEDYIKDYYTKFFYILEKLSPEERYHFTTALIYLLVVNSLYCKIPKCFLPQFTEGYNVMKQYIIIYSQAGGIPFCQFEELIEYLDTHNYAYITLMTYEEYKNMLIEEQEQELRRVRQGILQELEQIVPAE